MSKRKKDPKREAERRLEERRMAMRRYEMSDLADFYELPDRDAWDGREGNQRSGRRV